MKILHTEASGGLGGQELRILREAEGMRERGHEVIFAIKAGGGLVEPARASGFCVYELPWTRISVLADMCRLVRMLRKHNIDIINTHSSWDAWVGGLVGRLTGTSLIRTRHLSTPIRKGWNSRILYRGLADQVVTTCEATSETVRHQAGLHSGRCRSVPTGVCEKLAVSQDDIDAVRRQYGLNQDHIVIGTVCVLRGWKGVQYLLEAASHLTHDSRLRWLIVGDGPARDYLEKQAANFGVQNSVIFTGHLKDPLPALAAMDVFALLSTANEGVSQASLQAAYLGKPLITTSTGGLGEVCLDKRTGLLCPTADPKAVAKAVEQLAGCSEMRSQYGQEGRRLVLEKFTLSGTLDAMEQVYGLLKIKK